MASNPNLSVTFKMTGVDRLVRAAQQFDKDEGKVIAAAINKAVGKSISATSEPVGASQIVRKKLNIGTKAFKKTVKRYQKARADNHSSGFQILRFRRLGLIEFKARETKSGVSYKLRKDMGPVKIADAFIGQAKSGGKRDGRAVGPQVFKRKGPKSHPIMKLQGISVYEFIMREKLLSRIKLNSGKRLYWAIDDGVKTLIRRFGGK